MQQQPSSYAGAGVSSPASAHQPLGLNPISNSNTSQLRPQVGRKAVPVRKVVGGTNATAPKPQNPPLNAPVQTFQEGVHGPSSINTNLPNLSSVLYSTPQQATQEDLPAGWSSAFDAEGRVYYLNHITKQTSWNRPVQAPPALPLGWEERTNSDGRIYYSNTHTQSSSWDRPCGDIERRRSSVIPPGTSIRQGSVSTLPSGPISPNSSILSDNFSPLTSGPTSPIASTFQNPFFPPTAGLPSPTSSIPGDNRMISPGIEWEPPQCSTKQSRRHSQFSLSSISSASFTARKLNLHSLPTPHLPSNTPASLRQSIDLSIKGSKIAADYGKKGVKLVVKGAKNPNTRKTIAVGIKGFKIVNGIVKATTGVSLGAEFLPDLDLLPDGILGGGSGGDTGGGDVDVDVDVGLDGIGDGNATDGVDTSAFDVSGVDTSGFDASIDGPDIDSASVKSAEMVSGVYGVGVDTVGVDTVEFNTTEVDIIGVDMIEESTVEVDTVDVETIQIDTVQTDILGVNTISTFETDEYIVNSDTTIQGNYGYEQVDVGYAEEVDVSVWYIPGTDDDDERRRRYNQQRPHQNYPTHHPPHHPPHRKPLVKHPQAISPHSNPTTKPHLATKSLLVPAQMNLADMPAPLAIRSRRKEVPITTIHEIIHPQLPAAGTEPGPPNESENLETKRSINVEDPKTIDNIQVTETSPSIHQLPVTVSQGNISFPGPHDKPNPSQTNKNEDEVLGFDISSFSGDPFWARESGYLTGRLEINEDSMEKEVVHQAPPREIEKDSVPQLAVHSSCPYFPE